MLRFFKSSKVAPSPLPPTPVMPVPSASLTLPTPRLEVRIVPREHTLWSQFAEYHEATNEMIDYSIPGPLSRDLASLCQRKGAYELDSTKIMYFSETTNYFLELIRDDGERIGFLLLDCHPGSSPAKIWIGCISLSEKGKNYSKLLIDTAKEIARAAGKSTLHLEAISHDLGKKVYQPLGFEFTSPTRNDMIATLSLGSNGTRKNRKNRKMNRTTKRR